MRNIDIGDVYFLVDVVIRSFEHGEREMGNEAGGHMERRACEDAI